jgi:small multidrug resistance pump
MHYLYLALAIAAEVTATTALKSTAGFTRLLPSVVVVLGYCAAFYFLALCLERIAVGIAYAIWAGTGIVLIALLGLLVHGQRLDLPAVVGMGLIVAGVAVINLWSKMQVH